MKWPKDIIDEGNSILEKIDFNLPITPDKENVLNFLKSDPQKLKVVIIGQDPYPSPGVANGYAFAVNAYAPIPASLQNIFKEIKKVCGKITTDRTLKHWINQGVLLLNSALTTIVNQPSSHSHYWNSYIAKVIKWLDQKYNLVWVLWGNHARSYQNIIKNGKIIYDAHPSPLSFKFRRQNTFLELKEVVDINW